MLVTFRFGAPLVLLLLPAIPLLLWAARGRLRAFSERQRACALLLRGLLLASLVFALADPHLGRPDDHVSVVLAVDTSASIRPPQQTMFADWVGQARALARSDDRLSVIEFARWAAPVDERLGGRTPPADATGLADALNLAESLLPSDGRRRVVLLTDGEQTIGRAQDAVGRLAARGIEVSFVRPEPAVLVPDVLLRGLDVPPYQREGETLQLDALIESTHATTATLRLFLDDRRVAEQSVQLQAGSQRVPLVARPEGLGYHALRAEIAAPDDAVSGNDSAESYTVLKPSGRVLILESRAGEGAELDEALRSTGLRTEVRPASVVPPSASPLQVYDSIVLANVPGTGFTLDQQTTLQSYVEDYGRGLVVVGGNTSYSLGGYASSPLGELLPVDPTPPSRRELGSVALILAIDKSGSMDLFRSDVSKIAMAREAAILAAESLNPNDQVAVLAFDTRYQWVVPPTRLQSPADVAAVRSRIAAIQADGGTAIYPALEAAFQAAAGLQAKLKHIVLLTDGQSADGDYGGLIARMKPQNITLTTIGVGNDTDAILLARLAQLGDGRYYLTERPAEVPRIVTRETTIVSRNALVEGVIRPLLTEPSPLLADLHGKELPALNGYVATGSRPRAHTVLTSDRGDPLLANWQFGLGRVVAWTGGATSTWAGEWLESESARRVWAQAVRWSMPPPTEPGFQLSTDVQRDEVTIRAQAFEPDGRFSERRDVRATVVIPTGEARQVPLRQIGPGAYEVTVQSPGPGSYAVKLDDVRNGSVARTETGGFVIPSASELRTLRVNRPLLEQLAQATGGREMNEPAEAFQRNAAGVSTRWTPLWPYLLVFALLLLPLDVASRRLSLFKR